MRLEVTVAGDRRLAEEVILEIQARARGYGLDPPAVTLRSHQALRPKTQKLSTKGHRPKRGKR